MTIPRLRAVQHNHSHPDSTCTSYDARYRDESVRFWIDTVPESTALAIDYDYPGRDHNEPIYVPVEDARELAAAILASIPE